MTEQFGSMYQAGITDPLKVTRSAIQNAISVAVNILTTDALIADDPEDKNDGGSSPAGMGGGMPGMM